MLFASWRFVCLHEMAALVHYSLFRFELLACHLTIDQASKRPAGLVCADGNDRSVIDPNLFVPLRHARVSAPQIQTVHLSPTPLLKLGGSGRSLSPDSRLVESECDAVAVG